MKHRSDFRAVAYEFGAWLLMAAFLGVLALLLKDRMVHVDKVFGQEVGCVGCFDRSVLLHDLTYLSGLSLAWFLGFRWRYRPLTLPLRLLALSGLLVYALDIAVSRELFTRLRFGDVLVFAAQPTVLKSHLDNTGFTGDAAWLGATLVAVLALLALFWPAARAMRGRVGTLVLAIAWLGAVLGQVLSPGQYVQDWALRNVLAANLHTGVSRAYGEVTVAAALAAPASSPRSCGAGRGTRDDVIVLVLESWSPYQSALFGGMRDWTPELDAIARESAYFTRMQASGFSTNEGLMGLLAGMELLSPVKPFFSSTPFETTWGLDRTVPKVMAGHGYRSDFLTTGNLAFSGKGDWLREIGFDHVEGHDHPAYAGLPRLHFDAAPDEALYRRTLAHLDELESGPGRRPYLVVIESVSSHHPYVHPHTGARDVEAVFRYMDGAAAAFYRALRERGFFAHGRLLVTSDHRAMVPVGAEEREALGRAVLSRIPAFWVGRGVTPGRVDVPFHQADLVDTLDRAAGTAFCGAHGVRDMLAPGETRPRCLYHARGDSRDLVDVFCADGEGTIRLAGDDTDMEDASGLTKARQAEAVDFLNRYRIVRDRHQDAWAARRATGHP